MMADAMVGQSKTVQTWPPPYQKRHRKKARFVIGARS
jgi:hypothetical protein